MKAVIYPSKSEHISLNLPCSKSLAHRAIISASLASGVSHITNIDFSVDIDATIENMRHLGASIEKKEHEVIVKGVDKPLYDGLKVDAHESGSTLRFLIPVFSLAESEVHFTGSGRLFKRPLDVYEKIYHEQGLEFMSSEDGVITRGRLKSGNYEVAGNISSQFISGLLFTLPLLDGDSRISIIPPFESRSYVDLTIDILHLYGIEVSFSDEYTIEIKGNQKYRPYDYRVEADYSQLAFFASLGLINNDLDCFSFRKDSLQGDKAIIDIIKDMNGIIEDADNGYYFKKSGLKAATVDLGNCPDLGPMCFALATRAKGMSTFINAGRLRIKESDRIEAMECELRKMNQDIHSDEGTVYVKGGNPLMCLEELDAHNDHRIVMALSILGTVSSNPVVINHAEAINKSYPRFFDDLKRCNINVELYE